MTKSENLTMATRKEIMRIFLRTLVWIDDEIRPDLTDSLGNLFRSFFYPMTQELQKHGILVHLHPYKSDPKDGNQDTFSSDNSESFYSALNLARTADIILLDWHLGRQDPSNTIKLLKQFDDEPAIRLVVIMSQFADNFEDEMRHGDMLHTGEGGSNNQNQFKREGNSWLNDFGTHITVMNKPNLTITKVDEFCVEIFESIYGLMSITGPDYLHWSAFEIAGKLRRSIPGWIKALPRGTDAAILSELLNPETEARDFIPENLLEDLSHIAKLNVLNSLKNENCQVMPYDIQTIKEGDPRHKKFVHFKQSPSDLVAKDIKSMKSAADEPEASIFINSQQILNEFCEHISQAPESHPTFGSIYIEQKEKSDSINKDNSVIYLCVSQECDLMRKKDLILLMGNLAGTDTDKEGSTRLSFNKKIYVITPEASAIRAINIATKDGSRSIEGFYKVGQLRIATARRVLSRYWNHISRSAVNLPTFARVDRGE